MCSEKLVLIVPSFAIALNGHPLADEDAWVLDTVHPDKVGEAVWAGLFYDPVAVPATVYGIKAGD